MTEGEREKDIADVFRMVTAAGSIAGNYIAERY